MRPERKLLCVLRTGGGKTHLIKMVGTMLMLVGVHLVVHPLLVLAANQVQRFSFVNKAYGPVGAHNLDKEIGLSSLIAWSGISAAWVVEQLGLSSCFLCRSSLRHSLACDVLCSTAQRQEYFVPPLLTRPTCSPSGESHSSLRSARLMDPSLVPCFVETTAARRPFLLVTTATNSINDMRRLVNEARALQLPI